MALKSAREMLMFVSGRLRWIPLPLVLALAAAGCTPDQPTQLVAGMTTQMQVPDEIRSVGIVVQSGGRLVFCDEYPVADGLVTLPSTLATSAEGSPATPVTVTVLGFSRPQGTFSADCVVAQPDVGEDGVTVMRRRRSTYLENRALYLPMPIKHACTDVKCAEGETCVGGLCQDMIVDPSSLVDYDDRLVFGTTNTCFSVSRCLSLAESIPARLVDPVTCEFELKIPEGIELPSNAAVNVRVLHENYTPEVLDLDEAEGFVLSGEAGTKRFRLASNLCASRYKTGKILEVWATAACPSKTPLQPICKNDQQDIISGALSPFDQAACVVGDRLVPTESALYVIMDRSESMGAYLGADGLQQLLSLSLEDPVFERTRVAFKFLPAQPQDCSAAPNPFAAPFAPGDVPFTVAKEAQSLVAPLIADTSNVLASDPQLFLDAALSAEGAYAALRDLSPTTPTTAFNRRALLLVGNRDFVSHCAGVGLAESLAAAGLAEDIHTYVAVLSAPATTNQGGRDPVADAAAIATAGGTEVFDATVDSNVGATALQTIVTDLGSCLYDAPGGVDLSTNPEQSTLTYFNSLTQSRQNIAYNAQCSEVSTGASGWNTDSFGRIRVCGSACDTLRDTMKLASAFAAQDGRPAPLIPLQLTRPCVP